jgi:tRNA pseudouridine(55) synthase
MVGDTNKERIKYLSLDKAYEVEVLFGFSTDTGDILGLVKNKDLSFFLNTSITGGDDEKIKNVERLSEEKIKDFIGKVHFNYPIYSSKTVDGKPLFQHAREGTIHSIEIPTKEGEIYTLDILAFTMITTHDFIQSIEQDISKVTGDFRQNEIIHQWKKVLDKDSSVATNSVNKSVDSFLLMKIKCECSSGVYMRTLAEEIGKKVGVPALAYTIKRTAIDSLQLETLKGTIF